MAWRSSGSTNAALITNLFTNGLITSPQIRDAMLSVDRAHFCPHTPYADTPIPIGHAATISAPHMHALALSSLLPYLRPGAHVLDIGCGSGYLLAVFAHLVGETGKVVGVEHIGALAELARGNLAKSPEGRDWLRSGRVRVVKGDGRKGAEGRWDAVHVGAAAGEVHEVLVDQLKAPGRLFIPVKEGMEQRIWVVDKREDGSVERKREYGVSFVPLTDAPPD